MADSKMKLYYITGSPFSGRVLWALEHMPETVKNNVEVIRVRSGKEVKERLEKLGTEIPSGHRFTVPTLGYKDESGVGKFFSDGLEIIEFWIKDGGNEFADVTAANPEKIKEWNTKCTEFLRFNRGLEVTQGDNPLRYIAPRFLSYIPGLSARLFKRAQKLVLKAYGDGDLSPTPEKLEVVLQEIEDSVDPQQFLIDGKFSYADICLAIAVENSIPSVFDPPLTLQPCFPKAVALLRDDRDWRSKYPKTFAFRDKILKEHISKETLSTAAPALTRQIPQSFRK